MDFTCLVPAHNEAARVAAVLDAVVGHPEIARVLVIDDGSVDDTSRVAHQSGAEVLRLSRNGGKSAALAQGLRTVTTSHVVLIDADLRGLTRPDISALLRPVVTGRYQASLSLRGNTPLVWRLIGVDYITGERVLPLALVRGAEDEIAGLPRFGFEVFLNERILRQRMRTAIVPWPQVSSPMKHEKQGPIAGPIGDMRMLADIARTVSPRAILRQIIGLRSLAKP